MATGEVSVFRGHTSYIIVIGDFGKKVAEGRRGQRRERGLVEAGGPAVVKLSGCIPSCEQSLEE